ncbi:MAG: MYG1 family protein [Nanoarchaeota archaeon]
MKRVATHNGKFHADDVFAISILKIIYPDMKIIRTRDPKKYNKADARVDVGMIYSPKNNNFDHHQKEGAGKRKNEIPYASAGLIWKHFGKKIVKEESFKIIDEKIMQYVDSDDIGIKTYETKSVEPYAIDTIIESLNPDRQAKKRNFDKEFGKAVIFCTYLLKKEITLAEEKVKAKAIIKNIIKKSKKEYIILEKPYPWKETVINVKNNLKYVINYNETEKSWAAIAIPKSINSFEVRKPFPKSWGGISSEKLEKITGVKGAKFCHSKLFITIAKTKESIIKLVEIALKS